MCLGCDADAVRTEIESVILDKMCPECLVKMNKFMEKHSIDSIADVNPEKDVECHPECIEKVEEELAKRFN